MPKRDNVPAVSERLDHGEGAADRGSHVRALRAAYRGGRLVVSADPCDLARMRLVEEAHAIDSRDVADAMLRELLMGAGKPPPRGGTDPPA